MVAVIETCGEITRESVRESIVGVEWHRTAPLLDEKKTAVRAAHNQTACSCRSIHAHHDGVAGLVELMRQIPRAKEAGAIRPQRDAVGVAVIPEQGIKKIAQGTGRQVHL